MIRTLLVDLGNVLVPFSHERMCRQIGDLVGLDGAVVHAAIFDSGLLPPFERGEIDAAEFQRGLEQSLSVRFETEALHRAAGDIFDLSLPMRPLLDQLRHQGYRLVMLSNTCTVHYDWLRSQCDVFAPFHALVLSFQVGAVKPEAGIFQRALEVIHCDPEECFYTDDIPAYVEAARRFGLQAEVFTDPASFREQLRGHGVKV
ncbi:MAG: HAD family phosphatase [Planctomycetaceae bacterium]|nr:HAD family phosphatase [Planctomycetaceae bacterium]